MNFPRIYLDHAASAPLNQKAAATLMENIAIGANASSIHASGRLARKILEQAREEIAQLCDCHPTEVIFTSGGTESNNIALKGIFWKQQVLGRNRIIVSATEHHAILDVVQWLAYYHGAKVTVITPNRQGIITEQNFSATVSAGCDDIALVTLMWVNNEIGTITDISQLAQIACEHDIIFHTDAVAAAGHVPISLRKANVAALSISGHKFGAPPGIGAVILARDLQVEPLIHGGGHERNIRSGSYNYAAAAAMAVALAESLRDQTSKYDRLWELRDYWISGIGSICKDVYINGAAADRHDKYADQQFPGILNMSFPQCDHESLLMLLDSNGIDCSSGAACSAGVSASSHVLQAIAGLAPSAGIRFSFADTLTTAEIDRVINVLEQCIPRAQAAWVNIN